MRSPGDYIREELKRRNWSQGDLALIMGRPTQRTNELVLGKLALSPGLAVELSAALGGTAEAWLEREASYRLALAEADGAEVRRRARLYELAPVKELQKRGWIKSTDDVSELEDELRRFFGMTDLGRDPEIAVHFRKSTSYTELTSAQRAWCIRVRQVARALHVSEFRESKLDELKGKLRKLTSYSQGAGKVPQLLADYGIRFVVVEPLRSSKIDGAAMWLDDRSPVIALSIRYDRIDNFWHNIGHELSHIGHKDASVDIDLSGEPGASAVPLPEIEERANAEAASFLFPTGALQSFVLRVGPIYSKDRINQFANRVRIHPGIIVGQLQRRQEMAYSANREMLVKVREFVTSTAATDGWNNTIDPRTFQ